MKINNVNNFSQPKTQQQSFKAGVAISIPQSLYPKNWTEFDVENHFNSMVDDAIKMKPRSFIRKILNKTGFINPEVVSFIHYPGYKNIKDYLQNGKTWVESRINMKYGLHAPEEKFNHELPDIGDDDYKFFYLTNLEKDYFIANKPMVCEKVNEELLTSIEHVYNRSGKEMEPEDVDLTYAILKTLYDQQSFGKSCENNFWYREVKNLEKLPGIIHASLYT
jgi:hypothetical protein